MPDPKRRDFLAVLGAAALLPAPPKKLIVGAHPWVYAAGLPRNDVTPVLEEIFADFRYAGMDAIELMHTALAPDDAVRRIAELSRKHRLPVLGTSYSANLWKREEHDAILTQARVMIPRLAQLGGRTLGTSVGNAGKPKTPGQLDAQAELLRRLIALCGDHGVVLNLHNHIYEVANQEHDLRGTLERVPEVKLGPDIDWLVGAGVDPLDFIRRHGPRIVFAHLRDRRKDGVWSEAMGEGSLDYPAVAAELRKAGFAGDLVIELAHPKDFQPTRPLRESFKRSREYVRLVLGW